MRTLKPLCLGFTGVWEVVPVGHICRTLHLPRRQEAVYSHSRRKLRLFRSERADGSLPAIRTSWKTPGIHSSQQREKRRTLSATTESTGPSILTSNPSAWQQARGSSHEWVANSPLRLQRKSSEGRRDFYAVSVLFDSECHAYFRANGYMNYLKHLAWWRMPIRAQARQFRIA